MQENISKTFLVCGRNDSFMMLHVQNSSIFIIIFDINDIKWPEWYGFEKRRNVFATEIKRKPCDIFANANNKILTKQGWNNNVMLGANGGSVYYLTVFIKYY